MSRIPDVNQCVPGAFRLSVGTLRGLVFLPRQQHDVQLSRPVHAQNEFHTDVRRSAGTASHRADEPLMGPPQMWPREFQCRGNWPRVDETGRPKPGMTPEVFAIAATLWNATIEGLRVFRSLEEFEGISGC